MSKQHASAADVGLPGSPPKSTSEQLIAEARAQTKLQQSMEKSLQTVATAAGIFTVVFIIGLILFLMQITGSLGHLTGAGK